MSCGGGSKRATGRDLLQITGGLMIGSPDSEVVTGSLRSAREHQLDHELLDARADPPAIPGLHAAATAPSPSTRTKPACVFPEEAIRAHLDLAADNGAHLHFDERVEDWQVSPSGADRGAHLARSRYETRATDPGARARGRRRCSRSTGCRSRSSRSNCIGSMPAGGAAPFAPIGFRSTSGISATAFSSTAFRRTTMAASRWRSFDRR